MLYEILCWLLPCLTLAARVFYRAVATSDVRFVFDLHRDYLLITMMFFNIPERVRKLFFISGFCS